MTRCVRFFLSLIFVAGIIKNAYAGPVDTCSNSTLQGTYIFSANGYESGKYVAYTGMTFYDGKGLVKFKFKKADNSSNFTPSFLNGTYTVGADCQVNVSYNGGRKALYFLAPSGENFSYVITFGQLVSSVAVRISRDDLISNGPGG